jgi:hypothetical protein
MSSFDAPLYVYRNGWVALGATEGTVDPPPPGGDLDYAVIFGTEPAALDFFVSGIIGANDTILAVDDVQGPPSLGPVINSPQEVIFVHNLSSDGSGLALVTVARDNDPNDTYNVFLSGSIFDIDFAAHKTTEEVYELNLAFISNIKYGASITDVTFVDNPGGLTFLGAFAALAAFVGDEFTPATVEVTWDDASTDTVTLLLVPAPLET